MKVVQWATAHPISGAVLILSWILTLAWWSGMKITGLALGGGPLVDQLPKLLTSPLLHTDLFHLLFNSYWVLVFTSWMERRFGPVRTIGVLVFWAVVSGAAEFAVFDGGVGLSGVGYAQWAFLSMARRSGGVADAPGSPAIDRLFIGWFVLCIVTTVTGLLPVANVAHGAGAVIGGLCGWSWQPGTARSLSGGRMVAILAFTGVVAVAATRLRPWVNCSDRYVEYMLYEAWLANDHGNLRAAERLLRRIIDRDDGNAQVWTLLGHVLAGQDRDDELTRCCDRALELDPNDPGVRSLVAWWRGSCAAEAWQRDDLRVAMQLYEQSVELDNTRGGAWTGLGMCREALDDPEGAREAYGRALQLDPSDASAKALLRALPK